VGTAVFNPEHDMCYCGDCHDPRNTADTRGTPAERYAFPLGWCRFGLKLPANAARCFDDAHVSFHGTKLAAAKAILESVNPQLLPPGSVTESGYTLPIRPGHISGPVLRRNGWTGEEERFDPNQIFTSPTIKYCEYYADEEVAAGSTCKIAFQCRQMPGTYKVGQQTIGATHSIDPLFSNESLEWCVSAWFTLVPRPF